MKTGGGGNITGGRGGGRAGVIIEGGPVRMVGGDDNVIFGDDGDIFNVAEITVTKADVVGFCEWC